MYFLNYQILIIKIPKSAKIDGGYKKIGIYLIFFFNIQAQTICVLVVVSFILITS